MERGQREVHVALADEVVDSVVVEVAGAATHPYRGLFSVDLFHPNADGAGGSSSWMCDAVGPRQRARFDFDHLPPGRYQIGLYVNCGGELGQIRIARDQAFIDSAHKQFEITAPPLSSLEVDGPVELSGHSLELSARDNDSFASRYVKFDAAGRVAFFGLPSGIYAIDAGSEHRQVVLTRDTVVYVSK
jgi:hypothetical protein